MAALGVLLTASPALAQQPETAGLVPHEFTQTYWGDNQWLVLRARWVPALVESAADDGLGRKAGIDWSLGYQYRSDRSEFHPGLKSTAHTQPSNTAYLSVEPRLTVTLGRRWPLILTAGYNRTHSQLGSRQFVRNAAKVGAGVGWISR